jgi:DNA-binding IclR family transcriptional regulator
MKSGNKKDYTLQSVKNALRILRLFSVDRPELGVTEISRALGLSKSTVHYLMATLTKEGLLEKTPKAKYKLGLAFLRLTGIIEEQMEIHRESLPILTQLRDEFQESAYVGILEQTKVAYLQKAEARYSVPALSQIGNRNPAFCTGTGKAILAYQKEEIIAEIAADLHVYGPNSITDPEQFKRHLKMVKEQGYAICVDEIDTGITSIGVPVRNYTGKVIAAVSIVGATERIHHKNMPLMIQKLKEAGLELSRKLGYYR